MRQYLYGTFLILLISFSLAATGQTNPSQTTEQDTKSLLCHKWKLTHMEAQGQKLPLPPEMSSSYLTLKNDGTLIETDGSKNYTGKWSYDHKSMTLTTDDKDGKAKQKIIKLTKDQLILKGDIDGMPVNMIMKRAE